VSGSRVAVTDSARQTGAAAQPRRISADSFRNLTAKLKTGKPAAIGPTVAPGPIAADLRSRLDQIIPPPAAATVTQLFETRTPEPQAIETETLVAAAEPAADFGLPPIPEFAPLAAFEPVAHDPSPTDILPERVDGETDVAPDPAAVFPSAEIEIPPFAGVSADSISADESLWSEDEAAAEDQDNVAAAMPVLDVAPEVLAERAPQSWDDAEAVAADAVPLAVEALDVPALAVTVEPEAPAIVEAAPAPPAAEAAPAEAADDHEVDTSKPQSAIAGKVVEAMLKTISTAIYAKPSASERAAFLQEMAELMQAAVEQTAEAMQAQAPAPSRPQVSPAAVVPDTIDAPPPPDAPMAEALAGRMGPAASLLKPAAPEPDPFAKPFSRLDDPKPQETADADEETGELALTLLDMMSGGTGSLPHERTLAADTLLRILPRVPVKQLLAVVERVAIMENPPALLVAKLIRDSRPEVVAPLLERCSHISDQDLMNAAPDGDTSKLRMVARRRILSTVLSDFLISTADPAVVLTLIRNPGAALSHDAFFRLAEQAALHHSLLAPLATRADLPPPVAFELFWYVPQELRRFIFSRFLTDSENLNRILKITLATHGTENGDVTAEPKFPPRAALDAALDAAAGYKLDDASRQFAELSGLARDTVLRILSDREGEPFSVLMKALGCQRARFRDAIERLRSPASGVLRAERNPEEIETIFDSLSFNKARILLTYWDWYVRKAGPYAPHA
jgi:hypothetical protein